MADSAGHNGYVDSAVKRFFDVCLSGAGLVVSSPLWGLVALALKLEGQGPVFYRQGRIGKDGGMFNCLKFRSMVASSNGDEGAVPTAENDPRVTRVGRILRATAMDELPQLWNIFCGDMSFVGPRPEWDELVAKFRKEIASFDRRHAVRPGLTGLAQIYGDSEMSRRKKLRYDLLYIRRRSFWLDVKLVLASFFVTMLGRWEHRGAKLLRSRRLSRSLRERAMGAGRIAEKAGRALEMVETDAVAKLP